MCITDLIARLASVRLHTVIKVQNFKKLTKRTQHPPQSWYI